MPTVQAWRRDHGQPSVIVPANWQAAFNTRDIDGTITDWYAANTGHDPALSYATINGTLTITDSWLTANQGNGRVSFADGRWLVERYHIVGTCNVTSDNVTLRNIHVDGTNGITYGIRSTSGENPTGLIVEHSTVDGKMVAGSTTILFTAATEPDQIQFRHCNFTGFRAGIYCFGGITAEYCWSHDLHYTFESHNTGASIRSRNVTIRRCLIADGNSACLNCYAENSPYTGILIEQNIFRMPDWDQVGPELGLYKEFSTPQPGDTRRVIGNLFHRGGDGNNGGIAGDTFGFTEITGNIDVDGNPVTG